ncbi:MAG: flagellar basal body P-ring formation chaperone FlgA [Sulfuricellaceae bacterium]|nr:flagellar basal body P-ring formation chaperone FlgA [Sulfuricellaceae bacterium]
MKRLIALLFLLLVAPQIGMAATQLQDLDTIRLGAHQFVKQQMAGQTGQVSIVTSPLDPRLNLAACFEIDYFVPAGSRLWGNTNIGARCSAPTLWTIYIPATVSIVADIVFSARPLSPGQTLTAADIQIKSDDITQYAAGVISAPAQAIGKTPALGIAAGYPLRLDMLRAPYVILQGQSVRIVAGGRGFQVNSEGKALNNATVGSLVSVRTQSGRVIKAIAKESGVAEVQF